MERVRGGLAVEPDFELRLLMALAAVESRTGEHAQSLSYLEAARGMGLTRAQLLRRVELPLALPAIAAGLRIAVVSTISIATIAAFLLPKGLGYPIFFALKSPTPRNP